MPQSADYPKRVNFNDSGDSTQWVLQEEFVVRTGCDKSMKMPNEVMRMAPNVAICKTSDFKNEISKSKTTAVYKLGTDGPVGVPTGRLFVRISDWEDYGSLVVKISKLGFKVQKKSAAGIWLRHESEEIARSLNEYASLLKLPEIKSVEPQFEMTRSKRSRRR